MAANSNPLQSLSPIVLDVLMRAATSAAAPHSADTEGLPPAWQPPVTQGFPPQPAAQMPPAPPQMPVGGAGEQGWGDEPPAWADPVQRDMPQDPLWKSALMQVLSNVPSFEPRRGYGGDHASDLQRFAGMALPLVARGVGGALEVGLNARRADVNAKNLASTNAAKAKWQVDTSKWEQGREDNRANKLFSRQEASAGRARSASMAQSLASDAAATARDKEERTWRTGENAKDRAARIREAGTRGSGRVAGLSPVTEAMMDVITKNESVALTRINKKLDALDKEMSRSGSVRRIEIASERADLENQSAEIAARAAEERLGLLRPTPPVKESPVVPATSSDLSKSYIESAKSSGLTYKKFSENVNAPAFRKQLLDAGVDVQAMLKMAQSVLGSGVKPANTNLRMPSSAAAKDTGR
jgi:hypothetical protein